MVNFDILFQTMLNGLMQGGVYALIAIGLTLIYGVMKITNFAHGEFLMLGMYVTFWSFNILNLDPYLGVFVSFAVLFVLGAIFQKFLIEKVLGAEPMNQIMLTTGLSTFLYSAAQFLWGADNRTVSVSYASESFKLGPVVVNYTRLIAFSVSILLVTALFLFLKYSRTGKALRAASQNRNAASLMGIDVKKIYLLAFALGAALAGSAGALLTPFQYINPMAGVPLSTLAFVVVVLGTMGNFLGALCGGLIVGVAEALGGFVLGPQAKSLVSLLIFIIVLLFKPSGLFGGEKS